MRFEVTTAAEAEAALEYFNAFHDGFVAELRLTSSDSFPERGVHEAGRGLDFELTFAHYNYERDTRPANQRIRASFRGVMYLDAEVTGLGTESSITAVEVTESTRARDDGSEEACLRASVVVPRLEGSPAEGVQTWAQVEQIAFTFSSAVFEEL